MPSPSELVSQLYAGYFNRAPDPTGLAYWVGRFNAGMSLTSIAQSFSVQPEATALYSYLTNPGTGTRAAFITSVYGNLFNRAPDAAGTAYWTSQLANPAIPVGRFISDIISGAQEGDAQIAINKGAIGAFYVTQINNNNFPFSLPTAISILQGVNATSVSVVNAVQFINAMIAPPPAPEAPLTLVGTAGADILTGGNLADTISGLAGADTITGGGGGDTLSGGDDDDTFIYAAMADFITGGLVVDTITGGNGTADKIQINAAIAIASTDTMAVRVTTAEQLVAETQSAATRAHSVVIDTDAKLSSIRTIDLSGDSNATSTGNIVMTGVTQALVLKGVTGGGANTLTGGSAADTITGGGGADTINGDAGADSITGGGGVDILSGGNGDDTFIYASMADFITGGLVVDTITGDAGTADKIQINAAIAIAGTDTMAVRVTTAEQLVAETQSAATRAHSVVIDTDAKLSSIRTIDLSGDSNATSTGNIVMTGVTQAMTLKGVTGGGANTLTGGSGADTITGGGGADTITGAAGRDTITTGAGADIVVYAAGVADTVAAAASIAGVDLLNDLVLNGGLADKIDLTAVVANIGTTVTGAANEGTFILDLTTLLSVGGGAGFNTAIAGDISAAIVIINLAGLSGRSFLAVDLDASDTFTAADFVVEITGSTVTSLTTAAFI